MTCGMVENLELLPTLPSAGADTPTPQDPYPSQGSTGSDLQQIASVIVMQKLR
jgi:hypothetical protein